EESFARSFSDGQRPKGNAQFLFGSLRKPELFHGFLFRFAVHRVALDQYFKIHLVCFKCRAIHAGNLLCPLTRTRQPPHMPVPSIMMGLRLTIVRIFAGRVTSATAFIMGTGPTASTRSICVPESINWRSLSVTKPLSQ